jgi:peptidoglycan/xylan/chitin deacetylase (PgdA/CDA1 family)
MCRLCLPRRALLATPFLLAAAPAAPVEPALRLAVPEGVAITLDACPGGFDRRIADILIREAIPATIFATAVWMRRNPEALALLLQHPDLFAIENHGARHIPPVLGERRIFGIQVAGTEAAIAAEVQGGADAIARVAPRPRWYRAATGFYSPEAIPLIRGLGFGIAGYSLNADQGASLPAGAVAARIAAARPGDVIVAHINQPAHASGEGVAAGLLALQRRGMRFRHLDPA